MLCLFCFVFIDAKFLLRFLRAKKMSVTQARIALERYLCLRQCFGIAFCCLDITIPQMEELTDLGYLFAVPKRDKLGRRVVVARPGDYKKIHVFQLYNKLFLYKILININIINIICAKFISNIQRRPQM